MAQVTLSANHKKLMPPFGVRAALSYMHELKGSTIKRYLVSDVRG